MRAGGYWRAAGWWSGAVLLFTLQTGTYWRRKRPLLTFLKQKML